MLYIKSFSNYEEFKSIFGMVKRNNGTKTRQNKILLAHLKNRALLRYCLQNPDFNELLRVRNMQELEKIIFKAIATSCCRENSSCNDVKLFDLNYFTTKYRTDHMKGLCEDGDAHSVRYVNVETDRVYKMRAGKFMTQIMNDCSLGKVLSPQVVTYFAGDVFTQKWEAHTKSVCPELTLNVDDDFARIYSSSDCVGDFKSCMVNRELHSFYKDAVCAKAAYLTNKDDKIVCRAIIFTKCYNDEGNIWRLCERQYSTDCQDSLKRILVDRLIEGDYIDGYKAIGAGCCDAENFVANDGTSLSGTRFHIRCNLGTEDTLSYQDSFKWYDYDKGKAYNCDDCNYDFKLDTTNGAIEEEYDEYHDYYCRRTVEVYYQGRWMSCDEDGLDDFAWIESERNYYHYDDCYYCEECQEYFVTEDYYSELTEQYYCSEYCLERAEEEYKENYWEKSDYDGEYYESVETIQKWNCQYDCYMDYTISEESLDELVENGDILLYEDNEYYFGYDTQKMLPFGIEEENAEIA